MDAVAEFRAHALNPSIRLCVVPTRTEMFSSSIVRFATQLYNELPAIVEKYVKKVNEKLGTNYDLFNYYGALTQSALS